ncbi:exopolysaccharide biosynthesis polyprenyl glycosylphosphotransferase [Candidatus Peregrinibacteria bacterium]|nr:exopolysaccharide biosynthesis polyprenyl glycosylphosphotransferase [Candidatus Peregrinibacteria bacterium]
MKKTEALFGILRIPLDGLAVFSALALSYRLRTAQIDLLPRVQLLEPATTLPPFEYYLQTFVTPSVLVFILIAAALRLYALRSTESAWREMGRVILAALLWLTFIVAWYFLVRKELFYSRILLLHSAFFLVLLSLFGRTSLILLERAFLRMGFGRRLVVSIGHHPLSEIAKETLKHDVHYQYLGHVENLQGLQHIMHRHPLDLTLQTDPNPGSGETIAIIDYCRSHQVGYGFLPPVLADVPHLLQVDRLGLVPLVRFQPTPLDGWGRVAKRLFDIVVSAVALVLLSPLMLLIALAIIVDTGWPILYVSRRVGQSGRRRIPMMKFRSMVRNADRQKEQLKSQNARHDGPLFKVRNDPRVTRTGRFLRRWTLDELPQLLNVLLGHLSLVGPRPHLPEEVERYSLLERRVFAVKPGMTGLAQISGRSDLKFEDEVRLDLQYIEEWSLLLDLWILWRTVFTVIGRRND